MATNKELNKRVGELEDIIVALQSRLGLHTGPALAEIPLEERPDYIKHGSAEHAALLGLLPDLDNEGSDYKLADITAFGPQVTQTYLSEVLRQKIAELSMPMPEPQSDNPRAPHYAPTMWQTRDIRK